MIDRRTRGLLVSHGRAGRDHRKKEERMVLTTRPRIRRGGSLGQVVEMAADRSQVMSGYRSSKEQKHAGSLDPCHHIAGIVVCP